MKVIRLVASSVLIFLLRQVFTAQAKHCKSRSNEPCVNFVWQGCYVISNDQTYSYESTLGYEELFRDVPKENQFHVWQSQIPELVCRCANISSFHNYEYFALQFYSVCYGGVANFNASYRDQQACIKVNDAADKCTKTNYSLCFRIGSSNGVAIYRIVQENSTRPYTKCSGNEIIYGGSPTNSKTTTSDKVGLNSNKNETEDSKAALLRMFNELNNCTDIEQILRVVRSIIIVFKRPEIYKSFNIFKGLQESFMETLSKIVDENMKYLWKRIVKVQYLVEMVQEMSILTLRSISSTNITEYNFHTANIDIATNISSDAETSLYFNVTTSGAFVTLDNSFQGINSIPSSIAAILYKNIDDIFPANINLELPVNSSSNTSVSAVASPVVSIVSMQDGELVKRINGTIRLNKVPHMGEPWKSPAHSSCAYWKENLSLILGGAWSSSGLSLDTDNYHSNHNSTDYFTCRTNHFTSFAILMQVTDFEISPQHTYALEIITYFGCSLSLLCLLLTIITIPIMRLKETRFKIHLHLCIALAGSQAFFLAGMAAIHNKIACMVTAMCLHYFYTAAFMFMLVEGIHLYQKVVIAYEVNIAINERLYFLIAWGFPMVIVGIAFAVNREGYISKKGCWLSLDKGFRWVFITPVIVVLLANFLILIRVLMVMVTLQSDPMRAEKHGKIKLACKGVAILLPLLGLTWFFGVMSVNSDTIVFQYLFTIFNSLQGVFLFVFNYASNREVRMSFHRTLHRSQMSSL